MTDEERVLTKHTDGLNPNGNMAKWLDTDLSPEAHSWCGECSWLASGVRSHRAAWDHAQRSGHITHTDDAA